MRFLSRFMSEDMTNETSSDSLCNLSCIDELRDLGYCSSICFNKCPTMCKIVVVTGLSPPPVIHHDDHLKMISIIAASTIMTTLFLFALLVLCFKIYNRRRSMAISRSWSMEVAANWGGFDGPSVPVIVDHPVWHIRTIGLNPSVISSIKVYTYSKEDGFVEGTDCSVCLSEFEEEETLRLLPKCKHAFHLSCIDTWLRSHTNCPLCRAPIVVDDDDGGDSEDQEEILVSIPEENEEIDQDHEEEEADGFVSTVTRDGETDELQQRVRRSVSLGSLSSIRRVIK